MVINAYLLPLGALLLLGGAAGDRFGRVRLLVLGTLLFASASVACALAPDLTWLLAGRAGQGIAAAVLTPNSLAILGASFSGEARGRAVGMWAATGAVLGAGGPVLGGWLIDQFGWRTIFLINLPLSLAAIVFALLFVHEPRRKNDTPALDMTGGVSVTAALGALAWGLTIGSGPDGWTLHAFALVAGGCFLLLAFVGIEKRKGPRAMLPLDLFGSRSMIGLTLLTFFLYGALGALMVLIPYMLIKTAGYTAIGAGSALLPVAIILGIASPLMGRISARTGPRPPLTIGPLVVALGFLLLLRIGPSAPYGLVVFPAIMVIAVGLTVAVAPLTTAVLSAVDHRRAGSASGLNTAVARVAAMVATALLGGVLGAAGQSLTDGFLTVMLVCAAASASAGACAFLLVPSLLPSGRAKPLTR